MPAPQRRAALLVLAISAGRAGAAEFAVTSSADADDALPADGRCASLEGECTLRAAVQEANALRGPDRIVLPAGVFVLSIPGTGDDSAITGDLDLLDDVAITGEGADRSVVDASGLDRVFHIPLVTVGAEISGLTLRRGFAEAGGGILNAGALVLDRVAVRECHGVALAGGINNLGSLTVTGSAVINNVTEVNGGGIANDGGTMLLLDTDVSGNHAGGDGGGFGGPGAHTLVRTRVAANFAGVLGGGTAFPPGGSLVMIDSTVERNEGQQGGGIASGGPTRIESSTIADNVARSGGGGIGATGLEMRIVNSTISGNRAVSDGGGVVQSVVFFELRNTTITGNLTETGNGGGLSSRVGSGLVSNTILAGNVDLGGEAPDCGGTIASRGYNLIEIPAGCSVTGNTTGNLTGVAARLGPLADNGGPTRTHLPLPGSPAIDAGNPAAPESEKDACLKTDQRGIARPQDADGDGKAVCDIGAAEVGAALAGQSAAGGGWLRTVDKKKITFGLYARGSEAGPVGTLSLHDHARDIRIQIDAVEQIGPVQEPCGTVRAGRGALQFVGLGRVDGKPGARFRVCVHDGVAAGGPDRLRLECVSGCDYGTGPRAADDAIDGGDVEVGESR